MWVERTTTGSPQLAKRLKRSTVDRHALDLAAGPPPRGSEMMEEEVADRALAAGHRIDVDQGAGQREEVHAFLSSAIWPPW